MSCQKTQPLSPATRTLTSATSRGSSNPEVVQPAPHRSRAAKDRRAPRIEQMVEERSTPPPGLSGENGLNLPVDRLRGDTRDPRHDSSFASVGRRSRLSRPCRGSTARRQGRRSATRWRGIAARHVHESRSFHLSRVTRRTGGSAPELTIRRQPTCFSTSATLILPASLGMASCRAGPLRDRTVTDGSPRQPGWNRSCNHVRPNGPARRRRRSPMSGRCASTRAN